MYREMLCYRLSQCPGGRHKGNLTVGRCVGVDSMIEPLRTFPAYSFDKDCGLTVLHWEFSNQEKPTLAELADELRSDALSQDFDSVRMSDIELLTSVIARGMVNDYYGHTYWGREHETLHLLICGIDWSRFRGVDTLRWTSFDGTFAESDRSTDVLGCELFCRCDEEVGVMFGLEMPSIAQLIKSLSAGELERMFEV